MNTTRLPHDNIILEDLEDQPDKLIHKIFNYWLQNFKHISYIETVKSNKRKKQANALRQS